VDGVDFSFGFGFGGFIGVGASGGAVGKCWNWGRLSGFLTVIVVVVGGGGSGAGVVGVVGVTGVDGVDGVFGSTVGLVDGFFGGFEIGGGSGADIGNGVIDGGVFVGVGGVPIVSAFRVESRVGRREADPSQSVGVKGVLGGEGRDMDLRLLFEKEGDLVFRPDPSNFLGEIVRSFGFAVCVADHELEREGDRLVRRGRPCGTSKLESLLSLLLSLLMLLLLLSL